MNMIAFEQDFCFYFFLRCTLTSPHTKFTAVVIVFLKSVLLIQGNIIVCAHRHPTIVYVNSHNQKRKKSGLNITYILTEIQILKTV